MMAEWALPVWGLILGVFFLVTMTYVGKKTGTNFLRFWWQSGTDNIKTERRFGDEIRAFPVLNALYQFLKWGTPVVVIVTVTALVMKAIR